MSVQHEARVDSLCSAAPRRGFSRHRGLSSDEFKEPRDGSLRFRRERTARSHALPPHRLDEPAGLSLSTVASPQSRLLFHPAAVVYPSARGFASAGGSLLLRTNRPCEPYLPLLGGPGSPKRRTQHPQVTDENGLAFGSRDSRI